MRVIFTIFFWEVFINSALDNSNFFKTWDIKMGERSKRHSTKR